MNINETILFRYSVKCENDKPILYHGDKRVVCYEELFDVLNKAHIETTGHGGRDIMLAALDSFYGIAKLVSLFYMFYTTQFLIIKRHNSLLHKTMPRL
jgi:hypothetical protein